MIPRNWKPARTPPLLRRRRQYHRLRTDGRCRFLTPRDGSADDRSMSAALVALSVTLAASAVSEKQRAAIVVVDPDRATAAARQAALEENLADTFIIVPAWQFAPKVAAPEPHTTSIEEITRNITDAKEAYSEDDHVAAEVAIAKAAAAFERLGPTPDVDPAVILMWRVALALARGEETLAASEATKLIAVAPTWEVDLSVFRPSVRSFVETVRATSARPVMLTIEAPSASRVWVDGRPARSPWAVSPGEHKIALRSQGLHPVDRLVRVSTNSSVPLSAALALSPADEALFAKLCRGESATPSDVIRLWDYVNLSGARVLLVVSRQAAGKPRAIAFAKGKLSPTSDHMTGDGDISKWAAVEARALVDPIFASSRRAVAASRWTVSAGTKYATRTWLVDDRLRVRFGGAGPTIAAGWTNRALTLHIDGYIEHYGMSRASFVVDEERASATGGTTVSVSAFAGWRLAARALSATFAAGPAWERHRADPLRLGGGDLGVLLSTERVSADLLLLATASIGSRAEVTGAIGVAPWSSWKADGLAAQANADTAIHWSAGAEWHFDDWSVAAAYDGRRSGARTRSTNGAFDPPLTNAHVVSETHGASVSFRRSF